MLSTLSILLLLAEADVQLSLFKASAVWLLMLRAPSCSFALPLSYLQRARLAAQILFHVNERFRSTECQLEITSKLIIEPANPNLGDFSWCSNCARFKYPKTNKKMQHYQAKTRVLSYTQMFFSKANRLK